MSKKKKKQAQKEVNSSGWSYNEVWNNFNDAVSLKAWTRVLISFTTVYNETIGKSSLSGNLFQDTEFDLEEFLLHPNHLDENLKQTLTNSVKPYNFNKNISAKFGVFKLIDILIFQWQNKLRSVSVLLDLNTNEYLLIDNVVLFSRIITSNNINDNTINLDQRFKALNEQIQKIINEATDFQEKINKNTLNQNIGLYGYKIAKEISNYAPVMNEEFYTKRLNEITENVNLNHPLVANTNYEILPFDYLVLDALYVIMYEEHEKVKFDEYDKLKNLLYEDEDLLSSELKREKQILLNDYAKVVYWLKQTNFNFKDIINIYRFKDYYDLSVSLKHLHSEQLLDHLEYNQQIFTTLNNSTSNYLKLKMLNLNSEEIKYNIALDKKLQDEIVIPTENLEFEDEEFSDDNDDFMMNNYKPVNQNKVLNDTLNKVLYHNVTKLDNSVDNEKILSDDVTSSSSFSDEIELMQEMNAIKNQYQDKS